MAGEVKVSQPLSQKNKQNRASLSGSPGEGKGYKPVAKPFNIRTMEKQFMDEAEFWGGLNALSLTPKDAAMLMYLKTGVVVDHRDWLKEFSRGRTLSKNLTVALRFFFNTFKRRKSRRGQAA